ncbi:MAG: hypothetical protein KIS92_13315 [Planctomycetota bacterium]|nr:hypothetical protein [Planctomycetota bacterium]
MARPVHFLVWVLSLCAGALLAGEAPAPAPDAELLAKIEALPDNTWMKLPPCKTTGDMGILNKDPDYKRTGPRVRDYCNKMVWAPERKRALYCGGGHNIHPYNDVWEYDLASNTWICLYGADPAPPRTVTGKEDEAEAWFKAHAVFKDGVVRTPRGGPLRPCHTWWSLCYDPDQKRMLFLESHKGLVFTDRNLMAKALGLDPKDPLLRVYGSGAGDAWLFAFYPESGQWKEVYTQVPKAYESSCMEYLPEARTIWWNSGQTYLFDAAAKAWKAQPKGGPGAGAESVYDPDTKQVIATAGLTTWVYSCAQNAWTLAQKDAPDGGCVPVSTFCYDSTARQCVLYTGLTVKTKPELTGMRLWLYDVKANAWTRPEPRGETPKVGNIAGYYDPERNVTVIYSNGETWVYRCKKAAK